MQIPRPAIAGLQMGCSAVFALVCWPAETAAQSATRTAEPPSSVDTSEAPSVATPPRRLAPPPRARRRSRPRRGYQPFHYGRFPGRSAALRNEPELAYEEIEGELSIEGELQYEPQPSYGAHHGGCSSCGDDACSGCGHWMSSATVFSGVHAFKGPRNVGSDSSFGFHEGFNWGGPLWFLPGIGAQAGVAATHSNFSGSDFTDQERDQFFFTGGLFYPAEWGLQGGIVADYLHDEWDTNLDLAQIRGELSWVYPCLHEWGFWFTASTRSDPGTATVHHDPVDVVWESTDLFAFFYRRRLDDCSGGEARFYAGFSSVKDGLIGGDLSVPINDRFALELAFAYLIPEESANNGGNEGESWNMAVNLIWYPHFGARHAGSNPFTPLFRVADNGSFMFDRY